MPPVVRSTSVRSLLIATILFLTAVGCGEDDDAPALLVDVRTDYRPGVEFSRVRVEAGPADGSDAPRSVEVPVDASEASAWLGGRRVTELAEVPTGDIRVVATLLRASGEILGRQQVRIAYAGVTRGITLVISRDCRGATCPPPGGAPAMAACLSGMCVDESCSPDDLSACPAPACTSDGECGAGLAACASGVCIAGRCFSTPDDSMCASGLCDPQLGCSGDDAGMPDAGDAGDTGTGDAGDAGVDTGVDAGLCTGPMEELANATGSGGPGPTMFSDDVYFWRFMVAERFCITEVGMSISEHVLIGAGITFSVTSLSGEDAIPDFSSPGTMEGSFEPAGISEPTDVAADLTLCIDAGWWAIGARADDMRTRPAGSFSQSATHQPVYRTNGSSLTVTAGRRMFVRGCATE